MIPIPGFIISIITFPGVIVHEFAHLLFCRIFRVAVFDVCFFRFENPVGYVLHEQPRYHWQQVMIGIGPFFVNTILGLLIGLPAAFAFFEFHSANPLQLVLVYLGVSISMHAFPSIGDAQTIWAALFGEKSEASWPLKIITAPIVALIYIGAFGSIFWLDAAYGVGVVALGTKMVIYSLA